LVEENRRRGFGDREYELQDTDVFDENRYFDVFAEYAKGSPNDILARITVVNRGPEAAPLHVLPTLWCRNTWSWGCRHEGCTPKPRIQHRRSGRAACDHPQLPLFQFAADSGPDGGVPEMLYTDNETNAEALFGTANASPFVKDGFHEYVVHGKTGAVNLERFGTKTAVHYTMRLQPGESATLRLRLFSMDEAPRPVFGKSFDAMFAKRVDEADAFYAGFAKPGMSAEERAIQRQGYAGLLWSKQFYHYSVNDWLEGDPEVAAPPDERLQGRNRDWRHLFNRDVISVPDKWEYPWYAAWDLAFHMIPFARVDGQFARDQLILLLREWYMHPNGQLPAYEFNFGDVNPPVHAWACWRVYKLTGRRGQRDRLFLARAFQKLLLNFTWWVNRKDPQGNNLFSGGFLGLDNIGAFDRSKPLPGGGSMEQADGTAWMAFYCSTMLAMALELAEEDPAYDGVASKSFEHFVAITDAMNSLGGTGLWDESDGFYYDQLSIGGSIVPMKVRSLVGLIPLLAVEILQDATLRRLPGFTKRMNWFLEHRRDLAQHIAYFEGRERRPGMHLLAIPSRERLVRVLRYVLDESEFLSPFGIRSLSKAHAEAPFRVAIGGADYSVGYLPGESDSGLFGGNSNWRGPVWLPINFLLLEALEKYHHFYGDSLKVEYPTGSGHAVNLGEVARAIGNRLVDLFRADASGRRPSHGSQACFARDPHWKDLVLFHEYFNGDTGEGLGASHQTGWTALVVKVLEDLKK
jgi:hypothetical protein